MISFYPTTFFIHTAFTLWRRDSSRRSFLTLNQHRIWTEIFQQINAEKKFNQIYFFRCFYRHSPHLIKFFQTPFHFLKMQIFVVYVELPLRNNVGNILQQTNDQQQQQKLCV